MSRARKISTDLRHVATLAGTTAAVVEGAAIAAEKAKSVTDSFGGATAGPVDVADAVDSDALAAAGKGGGRKLLVLLLLAVAAAVGIAVWKKRSAALAADDDLTDLRDEARFSGSMP